MVCATALEWLGSVVAGGGSQEGGNVMTNFEQLKPHEYLQYDTNKYPFREIIQRMMEYDDLDHLNKSLEDEGRSIHITFENDQATVFHKKFYNGPLLPEFEALYHKFVQEHIAPMITDDWIVYQKRPTFRVCLPNNVAVGQKHRDGDYHHPAGEINFWLPFTKVWDSNGMYTESEPDKGDFAPIKLGYGQMFRFYGNKCWHYNQKNTTGATRVSCDFRVIPGSQWKDPKASGGVHGSVKSGLKFDIGSYYNEYHKPKNGSQTQGDGAKAAPAQNWFWLSRLFSMIWGDSKEVKAT